jgi:hypothetical protein
MSVIGLEASSRLLEGNKKGRDVNVSHDLLDQRVKGK